MPRTMVPLTTPESVATSGAAEDALATPALDRKEIMIKNGTRAVALSPITRPVSGACNFGDVQGDPRTSAQEF